jgi:signal transduction histidine kinase
MNEIGLGAAIGEWLKERIQDAHGLETKLEDHCEEILLDEDQRAILFRNVRELLLNITKHAQACKVTVSLACEASQFRITVQDDGIGFDLEAVGEEKADGFGFGLFSIRERMTDLGGSLSIVSAPGKGCKATLMIPLDSEQGQ